MGERWDDAGRHGEGRRTNHGSPGLRCLLTDKRAEELGRDRWGGFSRDRHQATELGAASIARLGQWRRVKKREAGSYQELAAVQHGQAQLRMPRLHAWSTA
jgi:hypothetical protein